ncbi:hypothetical protein SEA_MAGRITTE_219 [Microbacterium phage Magritte]|nr:hypothetical protein SEA_MAGRITTE_219 [Microbacterium phage Magritte]
MTHHLHIKVRSILGEASAQAIDLQKRATSAHDEGKISEAEMLFLEQDAIRNKILAAQAYAMMASPETAPSAEREQTEVPKDPDEPAPEDESPFGFFFGNPLDLLESVVTIGRAFSGPRPVKDTPQA